MDARTLEKFEKKYVVDARTGCWAWTDALGIHGYGYLKVDGKRRRAHRLAYNHFVGPIPAGLVLDHLCRNRGCVNPAHLEAVTQKVNANRGLTGANMRNKTHCPKGHEYTPENTRIVSGSRHCRTCHRARARIDNARRAERERETRRST